MIKYKTGDILEATENIICHQVNVDGVMGGGLALQIAKKYPNVEKEYKIDCIRYDNDYELLKATTKAVVINNKQLICNCYTQKPNFETDYKALEDCFKRIMKTAKTEKLTIAVPYKYGCGIAKGNWDIVEDIFKRLSEEYEIDINIYKLEELKNGKERK